MKLSHLFTCGALLVGAAIPAFAASYIWAYSAGDPPLTLLSENGTASFGGTFDLTVQDPNLNPVVYNKDLHTITSATVYFAFADDRPGGEGSSYDQTEYVDIFVGGLRLWDNLEVDGSNSNYNFHWVDQTVPTTPIDVLADLRADGRVSFSVQIQNLYSSQNSTWQYEDTWLKVAAIVAVGTDKPNVPDSGSTAILLGAGLIGATLLRRFRF